MKEVMEIQWLRRLVCKKRVIVNGKEFYGIPYILERLSDLHLRRKFTPCDWGFIHGDLHFGNILVSAGDIKLIDPNGLLRLPLEYDLGKILHSIHGLYNHIHLGEYFLKPEHSEDNYTFIIEGGDVLRNALVFFKKRFEGKMFLRSHFSECCHFLTMLPHHARNKKEARALYLRTLELFHEFFELEA